MNETKDLITYILSQFKDNKIEEKTARTIMEKLSGQKKQNPEQAIAIVGMDCRLPDAENVVEYWKNLTEGKDSIAHFPDSRRKDIEPFVSDDMLKKPEDLYSRGGFLQEIDKFDGEFFRISPRESVLMEPSQRLVLESAYRALEDGNVLEAESTNKSVGVYVGLDSTDILQYSQMVEAVGLTDILSITGSLTSLIAGRISYALGLHGPALVIDTSCSSGLVAVVEACKALNNDDCSVALAGGCNIMITPLKENSILEIESMSNEVRAFDQAAGGTIFSEGVCFVVLKRLDDAIRNKDTIYGVIRSGAINSDGASSGLTAPNPDAQVMLYQKAWEDAGINPETISYIEAHGTGTVIGDSIELEGIIAAFRKYTDKTGFCGVGSVKSNIGHTKGASGIASLIKVVTALQRRQIPASIHFETPNPQVKWDGSPIYINNQLKKWEAAYPLRAGVSSFGFSGTNAHLVVEEFRHSYETEANTEGMELFTLTAKTEKSLKALARSYINFLEGDSNQSLEQICYTANVCRPHFACRTIMIVSSIAELREKLAKIADNPVTIEELNIFYGICPEKPKEHKKDAMLSERNEQLADMLKNGAADYTVHYETISKRYIQGDAIPWRKLYPEKTQKVHLPGYAFEKKRVWIDTRGYKKQKEIRDRLYPLVDELLINTHDQAIYKTRLSIPTHWPLAEHKIYDRYVLPGTTLIDMATFVGVSQLGKSNFHFRDLLFLQTVTLDEHETLDLYIIVTKSRENLELQIISKEDSDSPDFTLHMKGMLVKSMKSAAEFESNERFRELPLHSSRKGALSSYSLEHTKTDGDLVLGPRWHVNGTVYEGKEELLADITILPEFEGEVQSYNLHPSLMDIAMNYVVGILGNDIYVPFSIKEFHIYGEMSSSISSYVTKVDRDGSSDEIIYVDVALLNDTGEVFAFLHRYAIKKLRSENMGVQDAGFFKKFFYRTRWIPAELSAAAEREPSTDRILFIRGHDSYSVSLVKACKDTGVVVTEAIIGDESPLGSEDPLFIVNDSLADYNRLIEHIKDGRITKIVHMSSLKLDRGAGFSDDTQSFKDDLDQGLISLCRLVQCLIHARIEWQTEIVLLTNNASCVTGEENRVYPLNGAYQAVAGVIAAEHNSISCRSIDIDQSVQVEQIIHQIFGGNNLRVAMRENDIFVPEVTHSFDNPNGNDQAVSLKHDGIYLVTGGMGGIGKEILRHLAKGSDATLIIIGRTILDESELTIKTKKYIEFINQLRSEGNRVEYYSVDVSDFEQMESCLFSIKEKYGTLDGIFHCAGVPGDKLLSNKSIDDFLETIAPKVLGTYNIDRITRGWQLDFILLFSSLTTILLPPGQMDYVAANAFLNSYADQAGLEGRNVKNILWPAWEDTGMAFHANGKTNEGLNFGFLKAISAENGVKAIAKVLNSNIQNAIVCELDYSYEYHNQLTEFGYSLDKELANRFNRKQAVELIADEEVTALSLTGKNVFTSTEQLVGEIWGSVLGFTELDVTADFHHLGGDSIHSIQITNEINKALNAKLDIVHIFDYPTISELSGYLDSFAVTPQDGEREEENDQIVSEYNLSEFQLRIWFIQKLLPDITIYNLPMTIKLDFPIEPIFIEKTINTIIQRHSVFRTVFVEKDKGVQQIILDDYRLSVEVVDCTDRDYDVEAAEKEIYAENNKPFDFSQPLIITKIYRFKEQLHYLYLNIHHLICDGWSSSLLINELMSTYQDITAGKAVDTSERAPRYIDWIASMEEWKGSANYHDQKKYWENELGGTLPIIDLPLDYKRPDHFSYKGDTHTLFLNHELKQKIKQLSASLNYSGHILMQSLFFLFLNRITGDEDIIVGIPVAGRDNASYEKVIGAFMNTLCIRLKWDGLNGLADLLEEVKSKNHGALRNGRMPFADLIGFLNPERETNRNPIFSVFFQYYDNIPPINEGTSQFDLSLYCKDEVDGIYCRFEYNTDLFRKETVQKFSELFEGIVKIVTDVIMAKESEKNVKEKAAISLADVFLLLEKAVPDESFKHRSQEKYWMNLLAGEWPALHLPYDHHYPTSREYNWNTVRLEVGERLLLQVKTMCMQENIPLSQFLLAVYVVVLSQYGKEEELIVGTLLNEISANILPLRMNLDSHSSFSDTLREVKLHLGRARFNGDVSFERLEGIVAQGHSKRSLFDVVFVYAEDQRNDVENKLILSGEPCPGNPEIVLVCENAGNKLLLQISYCMELFEDITVQRLGGHFMRGLNEFSLNIGQIPANSTFTTEEETAWIEDVINNTGAVYNEEQTIIDRFMEQVDKRANSTALVFADKRLTYFQLNERANKLAHYLAENGVGPDKVIGIMVERSLEMVIAILGVLKSGGTYLPIDVDAPRDRIEYILGHARADVLLVSEETESGNAGSYKEIRIDSPAIAEKSANELSVRISPANLAYIIYTSGSTGKPKGVMVSHGNVNNFLNWAIQHFSLNETDKMMLITAISFDISVLEIFGSLLSGAEMHIMSRELLYDPPAFRDYCRNNLITVWHSVPSLMIQYLTEFDGEHMEAFEIGTLRHIMLGGEAWSKDLARRIRTVFEDVQITNVYGPTEATIWVTSHLVGEQDLVDNSVLPIGKPIRNNKVYILDDAGKLCGVGIPGEICIHGDNVTRGYLNNEEKTRENFSLHPQYGNLYRTGDLGKYTGSGAIHYLGRKDNQVKVRGYRIELGEIENVLAESQEIQQCAVVVIKDEEVNRLVCYYEAKEKLTVETLRGRLAEKLPDYMLPSQFISLTKLPLTPNGKVDRKALTAYEITGRPALESEYVEPVTDNEKILAQIWSNVLDVKKIGIKDNFFAMGGNSIKLVQVLLQLKEYNLETTIMDCFKYRTIEELSEHLNILQEIEDHRSASQPALETQSETNSNSEPVVELASIEPFTSIFYKECFYNAYFPVVNHFKGNIDLFLANDVVSYKTGELGNTDLDVEFASVRDFNEIQQMAGLSVVASNCTHHVGYKVIQSLSEGRPVIIPVDCFFETIRPDLYNKNHWPHTLLIYGYDLNKRVFQVIEHDDINSLAYRKQEIDFNVLEDCYNGFNKYFGASGEHNYYEFFASEERKVGTASLAREMYMANLVSSREMIYKGLLKLQNFNSAFAEVSKEELSVKSTNFDRIPFGINNIINSKKSEIYKFDRFFEGATQLTSQLEVLIAEWLQIRLLLEKYKITMQYKKSSFDKINQSLEKITVLEYKYYESLYKYMDSIMEAQNKEVMYE